ncbi:unnamed protein product [Rotaria sp. Silwood2]|nr:unnamed protein product [Rotaria sp. Silwood2]CAF2502216.1 unnamed protein product [Rotaria sp. Silwood2]CAF2732895.1 unnamed protein product [Rotaria sp. Silwood2]CAF2965268.1 unnamed protein product [Rotaria sp. Silwood2]CAF3962098.1 unnamed protein product [Rotaria sp. Silwood2]
MAQHSSIRYQSSQKSSANHSTVYYPNPLTIELNKRLEDNNSYDTCTRTLLQYFADIIYRINNSLVNRSRQRSSRILKRSVE